MIRKDNAVKKENIKKDTSYLARLYIKVSLAVVLVTILIYSISPHNVYAYTDTNLYKETLEFDSNGNLKMTTHDKKATSPIIYRTIGWIIKRYDMPVNARGQQYAVIPMSNNVEYRDDPGNPAYVYCYYTGNKDTIENAIDRVSAEWKKQLFKYGDYVYIDEIMTVVERGKVLGGFNDDGKSFWGEVYLDYQGISNARPWASKENLKTHYDKKVYFPSQIKEKYFKKTEMKAGQVTNKKGTECEMNIGEGSKFENTYDVEMAVPTGQSLYVDGKADSYFYDMVFSKNTIAFSIPIKFVITYMLKWKDYNGILRTEKKDVIQWYYVNRSVSYYMVDKCQLYYLSGAHLTGYAFEKGDIDIPVNGLAPKIVQVHMNDYDYHMEFPKYNDVYYLDGGVISQMEINGVKPSIPDTNRQLLANSKIGNIKVKNDYLEINKVCFLDNKWSINDASKPFTGQLEDKAEVYSTGYLISHTKMNMQHQPTTGYYTYKEFGTSNTKRISVNNIKSVSIHTPVYIDGVILGDNSENIIEKDKEFDVVPVTNGEHIDYKGYGKQDYKKYTDKIEIKFDEDIEMIESGKEETNLIPKDEWIEWKPGNKYIAHTDVGEINMEIRAYAKNYISINNALNYVEEKLNRDNRNYIAYNHVKCKVITGDDGDEKEPTLEHRVVGTH